jgi:ribulose kinase
MADLTGPAYDAMIEAGKSAASSRFAWAVKMYLHAYGNDMAAIRAMHDSITDVSSKMTASLPREAEPELIDLGPIVETPAPDLFG